MQVVGAAAGSDSPSWVKNLLPTIIDLIF